MSNSLNGPGPNEKKNRKRQIDELLEVIDICDADPRDFIDFE